MALAKAIQGARHSAQSITWKKDDGTAYDLTGATITARLQDKKTKKTRAADGSFAITSPATSGVFTWTYGATDVRDVSTFRVQFRAAYSDSQHDLTYEADWEVLAAL